MRAAAILVVLAFSGAVFAQPLTIEAKYLPKPTRLTCGGVEYMAYGLEGFKKLLLMDQKLQLREAQFETLKNAHESSAESIVALKESIERLEASIELLKYSNVEALEGWHKAETELQDELDRSIFWDILPWGLVVLEAVAIGYLIDRLINKS